MPHPSTRILAPILELITHFCRWCLRSDKCLVLFQKNVAAAVHILVFI